MMGAFLRPLIGPVNSIVLSIAVKAWVHFAMLFAKVDDADAGADTDQDGDGVPL